MFCVSSAMLSRIPLVSAQAKTSVVSVLSANSILFTASYNAIKYFSTDIILTVVSVGGSTLTPSAKPIADTQMVNAMQTHIMIGDIFFNTVIIPFFMLGG